MRSAALALALALALLAAAAQAGERRSGFDDMTPATQALRMRPAKSH